MVRDFKDLLGRQNLETQNLSPLAGSGMQRAWLSELREEETCVVKGNWGKSWVDWTGWRVIGTFPFYSFLGKCGIRKGK